MARKTHLTLVTPRTTSIAPPRKLGKHGKTLWDAIQHEYGIADRAGIELLQQACEELDMIEGLSEDVRREGRTYLTATGHKAHAAIRDIRQGRAVLARLLRDLGVSLASLQKVGRPSSGRGISYAQLGDQDDEQDPA